jgi:hypothetical protein
MLVSQETLQSLRTEMAGLQSEQLQFAPRAPYSGQGPVVQLTVASVDRDASRSLPRKELAAPAGGHILVREFGF